MEAHAVDSVKDTMPRRGRYLAVGLAVSLVTGLGYSALTGGHFWPAFTLTLALVLLNDLVLHTKDPHDGL